MAHPPIETAQEHVRTALRLLDELERELRVLGFGMPAGYGQVGLLAAARRRLRLAVAALKSPPDAARPWVRHGRLARRRGWPVMIGLAVVAWPVRAFAFVLRCVWRPVRAAVRLVHTVRAIWP